MRNRTFRAIVAIFSVLLMSGTPVHAVPVAISEVLQVFGGFQNPPELRLRSVSQNSSPLASGVSGPRTDVPDTLTGAAAPARGAAGSLLSGVAVSPHEQQIRIDTTAQGDVQATICDCGEIFIAGGGFPKWPLLFLGAIPLFFIDHDDDVKTPTPTPIRTPTPTIPNVVVPEPSTALLLGTGLLTLVGLCGGTIRRNRRFKNRIRRVG
jgi:hypothetical protein